MRLFVALPIADAVCDHLGGLQDQLRAGHHVALHQMHITLGFFADVAPGMLADLDAALDDIRAWPFDVTFAGLDLFGSTKPRLLVAAVHLSPELAQIHRAVHAAARLAGLPPQRQTFKPHVTLVRFGARPPAHVADEIQPLIATQAARHIPGFTVGEMTLLHSTLGGAAPVYDMLGRYPFQTVPTDIWHED
ncbi:RNA 2',3'-cyclic phosphodiesterase [Phaeobacter sp. J2-8]|uniref:RNA 2',3'-cyclic phosphodiesterase n=1 Tax=Phaeobacter sp. J2-8 TaxID=2931394 RepID=UPI001FD4350F|nr:RNA 2',3'-cyclic phosphodiesterase [Phaeobacter sp. J2-8]MCJ7872090.1 RNA 2',3'-cyclic phosphodiesterase [Phaeobacter sp. J2-8]